MIEDFLYAIQSFTRNKTRTFLSLLGIIIGVASVIVITSMGASSTKQVAQTFGTAGLDVVKILKMDTAIENIEAYYKEIWEEQKVNE